MMFSNRNFFILWTIIITIVVVIFAVPVEGSEKNQNQTCSGEHLYPEKAEALEVSVTAPSDQLVSGYCVKAGSAKQGCGPMYVTLAEPSKLVVITYSHDLDSCDGKAISHYVVLYTEVPTSSTTLPPTTTSSTTTSSTTTTTTTSTTTTTLPPTTTAAPTSTSTSTTSSTTTLPPTTTTIQTEVLGAVEVASEAVAIPATPKFTG